MNLFGSSASKLTVEEQVKEWKRKLTKEGRNLDREIEKLRKAEQKSLKECKKLAKDGQVSSAKILAKEIVNVRKAMERMYTAKAQLNSVNMNLQTAAAIMKVQGCVKKSADIMKSMNSLMNMPELRDTMNTMSREMMKSGLIDEIIGDAMSSMESDGLESAADVEVDRIITELTADALAPAGSAPVGIKKSMADIANSEEKAGVNDDSEELKAMQSRLQSL